MLKSTLPRLASLALPLALLALASPAQASTPTNFAAGTLIVPMDTTYQDSGIFKAFGLADKLLRAGVPVRWVVKQPKTVLNQQNGTYEADFTASAVDIQSNAAIANYGYRGGPFVIDSADVARATPVITAWQAGNITTVHRATAAFTAPVARTLTASPRVGVLLDGYEQVAFGYLNAAGIPDSAGNVWPAQAIGNGQAPPDVFTVAQVAGASVNSHADGKLFRASGQPAVCNFSAMHFDPNVDKPNTPEAVAELTTFVQYPTHVNAECLAVRTIEGSGPQGLANLLTPSGINITPQLFPPNNLQFLSAQLPVAQLDGPFGGVQGAVGAFAPATSYLDADVILIADANKGPGFSDVWATGYAFGACPILTGCGGLSVPRGRVSYLGGHEYTVAVPLSRNSTSQGARLWLNALFDSACTYAEGQPSLMVSLSAPAATVANQVVYTIDWKNTGAGAALGVTLTDVLPANTTFVSASGGGVNANGTVTWNLGDIGAGASGQVTVTLNLNAAGLYTNSGTFRYTVGNSPFTQPTNNATTRYNPNGPLLAVTASAPATTSQPGVTFTVNYVNSGKATAQSVGVSDALPPGVTYVSSSNGGVFANGVVTWTLGNVAVNGTGSLTVNVTLNSFGTFTNLATATFSDGQNTLPTTSNVTSTVYGPQVPRIVLGAEAPAVTAVSTVNVKLNWTNQGVVDARSGTLTYPIPAGATFVSATGGGTQAGGVVTWTLGDLKAGTSGSQTVTLSLGGYGSYLSQGKVVFTDPQNVQVAVSSNTVNTVFGPNKPSLQLTAAAPAQVNAAAVTWTLAYANVGSAAATGAVISEALPPGATNVVASNGGALANGVVTWNLGTVATAASGSLTIAFNLPSAGYYQHQASGTYKDPANNTLNVASNIAYTSWVTPVLLTASAPASVVSPGVTFTIAWQNTTGAAINAVTLTDPLPNGAQFVSATNGGAFANGTVTWNLGNLAAGASGTVSVTLNLPAPGSYTNQASAAWGMSSTRSNITTTLYQGPMLSLVENGPTGVLGNSVTYTLTFSNAGPGTASKLVLTNPLPNGATFGSASNGGTNANGTVTWTIGDVPAGVSGVVSYTVTLPAPGSYASRGTGTYTPGVTPVSVNSNTVTTVWGAAGLNVVASAPERVTTGAVTFTLDYANSGAGAASNVVVSDVLPMGTTFVLASNGGVYDNVNRRVTWNVGNVAQNAGGTLTLTVTLAAPGTYANQATATFTIGGNNGNTTSNTTSTVYTAPGLQLVASAPASVMNPQITLTVDYENNSGASLTNVTLSDLLPAGATFVSASNNGTFANGIVTWNVGTVAAAAKGTRTVTVSLAAPGTFTNDFGGVFTAAGNTSTVTSNATTTQYQAPPISLVASAPASTPVPTVTFKLDYKNNSNAAATNLVVTDTLPANVTFISASNGGAQAAGKVTWTLPNLAAGASGTLTVDVKLNVPGTYANNAAATYTTGGMNQMVTSNTTSTVYAAPNLVVIASGPVQTGTSQVTYTITWSNSGSGTALGVVLTDTVPVGAQLVSITGGGNFAGGVATWTIGDVPPGGNGTVGVTVNLPAPGIYTNTGSTTYTVGNMMMTVPLNTITTDYLTPQLTLTAMAPATTPDGQVLITIAYANNSMATVERATVADTLPMGALLLAANPNAVLAGGVVTWTLGSVAPGAGGMLSATIALPGYGTYSNSAVGTFFGGLMKYTVQSNVTMTTWPLPAVTLMAAAPATTTNPAVTFTITYANGTNRAIANLVVSDPLPPGVTNVVPANGGVYDMVSNTVTWTVGNLAANANGMAAVTLTLPQPGVYTNRASATYVDMGPTTAFSNTTSTTYMAARNLVVTVSGPQSTTSDVVTYTIRYTNFGNATDNGVVLTDALPMGATFLSASNGGVHNNGVVSWNIGDVPPGGTGAVTVTVRLPAPGTYNDQAMATYMLAGMPMSTSSNTLQTTLLPAGMNLVASAPDVTWSPTVTFTITWSNTGAAVAKKLLVVDALPVGATFVSATQGGVFGGGVVTWTVGDVPVGGTGTLEYTAQLAAPGSYANRALGSYDASMLQSNITNTDYLAPDLVITLRGPATTTEPTATYSITFDNLGNAPATAVTLLQKLPPGATLVSASDGGMLQNGVLTWPVGDVPPLVSGTVTFTVKYATPGDYTDRAGATYTVNNAPQTAQSNVVNTTFAAPNLVIVDEGAESTTSPTVTYTIRYSNTGNAPAKAVVINDPLPSGATFVAASRGGTLSGGVVSWNVGDVQPATTDVVQLTVTLPGQGTYTNQPSVTFTPNGGNPTTVQGNPVVTVFSPPSLAITAIAPDTTLLPGATYTLAWRNDTGVPLAAVSLTDKLLPGTTFASASNGGSEAGGVVTWNLGNIGANSSGTVSVVVGYGAPGLFTNSGAASFTVNGQTQQALSNYTVTRYLGPGLVVVHTGTGQTSDGTASYTITATNTGMVPVTAITVSEPLPSGATLKSASNGGQLMNGAVVWPLGDLAPGVAQAVTATVNLPRPGLYTTAPTAAFMTGGQPGTAAGNPVTTVYAPAGVNVTASAPTTTTAPKVTFTLDYANQGQAAATGLVLSDPLPPGATFVSATNGGAVAGNAVTWKLPDLMPGASGTVSMVVTLPAVGTYTNQGTASYTSGNLPLESPSNVTSTLYVTPSVTLVADAPTTTQAPRITINLAYTNAGLTPANNTVLRDKLPPGTAFVSATNNGAEANGVVAWTLGTLMPGQMGMVSMTLDLGAPGVYTDTAAAAFTVGNIAAVTTSNTTTTVYSNAQGDGGVDDGGTTDGGGGTPDLAGGNPCAGRMCGGKTPVCDPNTGMCIGCRTDADCGGSTPACQPDGSCGECSATNFKQCAGLKPVCNVDKGLCALCTPGGDATACAKNPDGPVCEPTAGGGSVFCGCDNDSNCGGPESGRVCDLVVHKCTDGCSASPTRNHCPAALNCTNMDPSGATLGQCTTTCQRDEDCVKQVPIKPWCDMPQGGMNQCVQCRNDGDCANQPFGRNLCNTASHLCVQCHFGGGMGQCNPATVGGVCLTDENCGCLQDSDCGAIDSGRACDTRVHQCVPGCRGTGGNRCPAPQSCSSTDTTIGTCSGGPDMAGSGDGGFFLISGGGCSVGRTGSASSSAALAALATALAALIRRRRRRRA